MANDHGNHDHPGHHIVPLRTLLVVFASLIFLTLLTWMQARLMDLGSLEVPVALAIAGAKATLVVLFFMALKYDYKVNALIFSIGALFVLIFMIFTSLDVFFRDLVDPTEAGTIWDREVVETELRARDSVITPLFQAQPLTFGSENDIVVDTTLAGDQ